MIAIVAGHLKRNRIKTKINHEIDKKFNNNGKDNEYEDHAEGTSFSHAFNFIR